MTLDDIKEILKTQNIKNGIFGTYDVKPIEPNPYGLDVYDVIDFLQENFMEVEHPFGEQWSFDDVFFETEGTEDFIITYPENKQWNSYNWNSPVVMQAIAFIHKKGEFVAVRFHKYGDVRANYTDFVVLACNWEDFNERLYNLTYEYALLNASYYVEQRFFDEEGILQVWDDVENNQFEVKTWKLDDEEYQIPSDLRSELKKIY